MVTLLLKYLSPILGVLLVGGVAYHVFRIVVYKNEIYRLEARIKTLERKNADLSLENQKVTRANEDLALHVDKQSVSITRMEMEFHKRMTAATEALKAAQARSVKIVHQAEAFLKRPDVPKELQCTEAFQELDVYLEQRQASK